MTARVRRGMEILLGRYIARQAQSPQPYDLVIRPCTIYAGRFRWDIRKNGPVQSCMESFASEQEAREDGRRELERLTGIESVPPPMAPAASQPPNDL
jgi:hypothetical protein